MGAALATAVLTSSNCWLAGGVRDPRGPEVTRAEGEEAPQPGRDPRQVSLRLV